MNNIQYKITIQRLGTITREKVGAYGVVSERVPTDEELKRYHLVSQSYGTTGDEERTRRGVQEFLKNGALMPVYDYAPKGMQEEKVDEKVYEQIVSTIDLPGVILAVNKLSAVPNHIIYDPAKVTPEQLVEFFANKPIP